VASIIVAAPLIDKRTRVLSVCGPPHLSVRRFSASTGVVDAPVAEYRKARTQCD